MYVTQEEKESFRHVPHAAPFTRFAGVSPVGGHRVHWLCDFSIPNFMRIDSTVQQVLPARGAKGRMKGVRWYSPEMKKTVHAYRKSGTTGNW